MGAVVGAEVGALVGEVDADPGADVALVGQGRQPGGGGRIEGGQNVPAGGAQVVGGAGFDRRDPDREPARVGDDLDVPAVAFVFPGLPQVMSRSGCRRRAGGSDQGAIEAHVRPPGRVSGGKHLGQVRQVGGDHRYRFV